MVYDISRREPQTLFWLRRNTQSAYDKGRIKKTGFLLGQARLPPIEADLETPLIPSYPNTSHAAP